VGACWAKRQSAADFLTLAAGYGHESSSGVLNEVVEHLGFLYQYLTTDATRSRFEAFTARCSGRCWPSSVSHRPASETDDRRAFTRGHCSRARHDRQ